MKSKTRKSLILATLVFPFVFAIGSPVFADDVPEQPGVEQPSEQPGVEQPSVEQPGVEQPGEEAAGPVDDIADKDASEILDGIVNAFNAKNWGIFAGFIVMAFIWGLKKFAWKSLSTSALPWVSAAAGVVAAIATSLVAGQIWWKAILNGLTVGAAASGLWSMLGKYIFGKYDKSEDGEDEKEKKSEG